MTLGRQAEADRRPWHGSFPMSTEPWDSEDREELPSGTTGQETGRRGASKRTGVGAYLDKDRE